jgi:hypothetical protein
MLSLSKLSLLSLSKLSLLSLLKLSSLLPLLFTPLSNPLPVDSIVIETADRKQLLLQHR